MSTQLDRIMQAVDATAASEDSPPNRSQATELVELAQERYTFCTSMLGEPFAIRRNGPRVVAMLRGSRTSLRAELAREYFRRKRRAASQQALADCLAVLDGLANEAEPAELNLRVARHDDAVWVDVGDQSGRAIRIAEEGWSVKPAAPVLFRRTALTGAMPDPAPGHDLRALWRLLNVADADRPLIAAWLVTALLPDVPHPVLTTLGEQGAGKSSAMRMLVSILDPSPVLLRKPPRDPEAWVTAAAGSWIVALDNLSEVRPWLSDGICRAVTGDGDVRRKLYTDGEHSVFAFRRVIALNSIDLGAIRGDLADRMLTVTLTPFDEAARRTDEALARDWLAARAGVLGAVLDLAVQVLRMLPSVEPARLPRMADFGRILTVVDAVLGSSGFSRYQAQQTALATDSLTGDPFMMAIAARGLVEGTSAQILDLLAPDKPPRDWPASAREATQQLRRQAPVARKAGWIIENDDGRNRAKVVRWRIAPPQMPRNSDPPDPQAREKDDGSESAGLAGHESLRSQVDLVTI